MTSEGRFTQRMRKRVTVTALVGLCAITMTGCSTVTPANSLNATQAAALATLVTSDLHRYHVPGAALEVVSHGHVSFYKGIGTAKVGLKQPIVADTTFAIGSLTKSITATALLQLRDEGKLKLTDSVQKYLPWFRVAGPYPSDSVTLYDLLTQTSGIPDTASAQVHLLLVGTNQTSIEAGIRELQWITLDSQPGSHFEYSNMNYDVLGMIVQQISGKPYANYIETHIFKPLDMLHTTFDVNQVDPRNVAGKYVMVQNVPTSVEPSDTSWGFDDPAGSRLLSTSADMAKYLSFELGDGPSAVLHQSSLQEARTQGTSVAGYDFPHEYGNAKYAYGWVSADYNGIPYDWHNGATQGSFSWILLFPTIHTGVILLSNDSDVPSFLAMSDVASVFLSTKQP